VRLSAVVPEVLRCDLSGDSEGLLARKQVTKNISPYLERYDCFVSSEALIKIILLVSNGIMTGGLKTDFRVEE
jgi:hypothetical protein